MKKVLLVGIIGAVIIGGSIFTLSMNANFSLDKSVENLDSSQTENDEKSKSPGRDLSIELEEKMGISTP